MLKFLKLQMIILLAVLVLVSMESVFASEKLDVIKDNEIEEKWRFEIGKNSVKYGTKYTIIIDEEKYEFYIPYEEIVLQNDSLENAKFVGHYWGMNENVNIDVDDLFIYSKNKTEITRKDVVEFLKIKDEKLVAKINEGCEFSLFIEPYYKYKKSKWGEVNVNTVRELYAMLPEVKYGLKPYENATNEKGIIDKSKIHGIEFFREMIIKTMNEIQNESNEFYDFRNDYKNQISEEMLNNGWCAYHYEEEITTGEFLKLIVETLWPEYVYKEPSEGNHWTTPYMRTMDDLILDKEDFDNERLERVITREEAAKLIYNFSKLMHRGDEKYILDENLIYITLVKDKNLITDEESKLYVDNCLRLGLMKTFGDRTFKPLAGIKKDEAQELIFNACR